MKQAGRRWLAMAGAAMLASVGLAAGVAAWRYRVVSRQPLAPPVLSVSLVPGADITLGEPVTATVSLALPWHVRPGLAMATPGEGTQAVGAVRIQGGRLGWGRRDWRLAVTVQPYRDGETGPGRVEFRLEPPDAAREALVAEIPPFAVRAAEVAADAEPELAGKLSPTWRDHWDALRTLPWHVLGLIVGTALLLLLGLGILIRRLIIRRLAGPPPPPPWETALARLRELRTGLMADALAAEAALQRLSDVVRAYLEDRFRLHAPRQTTAEFLRDLERTDSPLAAGDRAFLGDFLKAADLVKFARLPADRQSLDDALGRAEALVRGTVPADDGNTPPPSTGS